MPDDKVLTREQIDAVQRRFDVEMWLVQPLIRSHEALRVRAETAEADMQALALALLDLYDRQKEPPLSSYEKGMRWEAAMLKSEEALARPSVKALQWRKP